MKRKEYETPTMLVIELKQREPLLTISDPSDYKNGGDPFNSPSESESEP